jgi:LuxR family quorum sensing-dependent transcriptional regulator
VGGFEQTLDYIERLRHCVSVEEICRSTLGITSLYGLDKMIAGTLPDPAMPPDVQRDHVIIQGWPEEWLGRYFARNYIAHDPVATHMRKRRAPFQWSEAAKETPPTDEALIVLSEARDFHLCDGLAFPLTTLDGAVVIVSLGGEKAELAPADARMISLVCTYAIGEALLRRTGAPVPAKPDTGTEAPGAARDRPDLTAREQECLKWAALGKSEWEISRILGISEHTSEKHLLSAKAKLGAANRVQAVAEAIRRGYIS